MARTFIRQATQIRRSDAYDDTLVHGAALEQGAVSLEDDLNGLRAQIKRILDGTGGGKWYDNVPAYNGTPAGLAQVHQAVSTIEQDLGVLSDRTLLVRAQVLADVAVPAGQNFVDLSVANGEAPTQPLALVAGTHGVVAATAAGAGHALDVVAGANAISPKNLVLIREAVTNNVLQSDDRDVYGLLQAGAGATDGVAIDDADNAVRISFVRITAAGDGFEAVPPGDLDGFTLNYSYVLRTDLSTMPEDAFLANGTFTDLTAEVDVTMTRAVANQGATDIPVGADLRFVLADGSALRLRDDGGVDRFVVGADGTVTLNSAGWDVNNTAAVDISGEVRLGTAVGGVIMGRDGSFIESDINLGLRAGTSLIFSDGAQTASTFNNPDGLMLTSGTIDWDNYQTRFAGRSILGAIYDAAVQGTRGTKTYATVTANIAPDTDIGGTGGGGNLDAQLPNMNYGDFVNDFDVYVNGELMRGGNDAGANNDYYPGTNLNNGQLRFEFGLRTGDVICVVPVSQNF